MTDLRTQRLLRFGAVVSVAINVSLAIAIVVRAQPDLPRPRSSATVTVYPQRQQERTRRVENLLPATQTTRPSTGERSPDVLRNVVSELRAAGYPSRIIRPTVLRLLEQEFDQRVRALLGSEDRFREWKRGSTAQFSDEERENVKALAREVIAETRALLSDLAMMDDAFSELRWERQLGAAISWEKFVEIGCIDQDYVDLHRLADLAPGNDQASRRQQHELIERERRADIKALLSEEELEEFDLRYSPVTGVIKAKLRGRSVTEEESRRLFREQRSLDRKMGGEGGR